MARPECISEGPSRLPSLSQDPASDCRMQSFAVSAFPQAEVASLPRCSGFYTCSLDLLLHAEQRSLQPRLFMNYSYPLTLIENLALLPGYCFLCCLSLQVTTLFTHLITRGPEDDIFLPALIAAPGPLLLDSCEYSSWGWGHWLFQLHAFLLLPTLHRESLSLGGPSNIRTSQSWPLHATHTRFLSILNFTITTSEVLCK